MLAGRCWRVDGFGEGGEPRPALLPRPDSVALVEAKQRWAPFADPDDVRMRLVVGRSMTVLPGAMAGVSVELAEIGRGSVTAWLPMLGSRRLLTLPIRAFVEHARA